MPRLVNQSFVDENIAMFLQYGLSEESDLMFYDDVIAREIQQQYQNNSTFDDASIALEMQQQEVNDDVIARVIQQQYQNNSTFDDAAIALEIQQQEGNLHTSLSDDEKLARYLQQQDELDNSYIPDRDAPSTSRTIIQHDDDDHFSGHHTHTRTLSDSPSISALNLSNNENIDPANMTYEELNELEDSMGDVDRGLSQMTISKLPTHKYGEETKTWWWQTNKNKFTTTQCSICLVDYVCCICKAEI
ncbi:unnamed protein product [Eruca vesicaria subsp. sativa]|uniref:Uncharacterized protein n=1 Tax=Eruca vesicaria subsp. sativa TaxID=29727 RepID=A0ABC8LD35_ERUVS|nr:unnamed protein product [Eruca vesicaria subsp. sativa]